MNLQLTDSFNVSKTKLEDEVVDDELCSVCRFDNRSNTSNTKAQTLRYPKWHSEPQDTYVKSSEHKQKSRREIKSGIC